MKTFNAFLTAAVIGGSLLASLPAKADIYFRDNDRVVLHDYVTTTTKTTTTGPEGTVTYYTPGTALPDTVTYTELPSTVTERLAPAPDGDEYVVMDGNAYLIDRDRRVVVDGLRLGE